jgi:preprotein translocase subunit SecA
MNCTTEINYYRVENNMKKIKSSKKRKYTTDITDLTASEIDFDFVNKNYITNAEHIQKRNA